MGNSTTARPALETTTLIRFTEDEAEILLQRLTVPECIAEALTDRCDDEPPAPYTAHQAEQAALAMERHLDDTRTVVLTTDLDRDILADAVDGNQWRAFVEEGFRDGDETFAEVKKTRRLCGNIERKLAAHGIRANFPRA